MRGYEENERSNPPIPQGPPSPPPNGNLSQDIMPKGEEKGGEKWMTDQPTNTVLLRGLPVNIDEKDVSEH